MGIKNYLFLNFEKTPVVEYNYRYGIDCAKSGPYYFLL
jgi:hypothetical protein